MDFSTIFGKKPIIKDETDKQLERWYTKELERSKNGRVEIINGKLWNIPPGHIILCRRVNILGITRIFPTAVAKIQNPNIAKLIENS